MQLSIIIVNYNVKYFLEQCLYSVRKASTGLQVETIVVDNNSSDGSIAYLKPQFGEVSFIEKETNAGFAKACNEGLSYAKGEHVLFLNPDTLLAEDTLKICIKFFGDNNTAGAIGVRMIDGRGVFLKESKRSFPSPLTSLFKLFGASVLFPRSRIFGRYHLGHLSESQNHEVDVLAGAFMMIPKKVLDAVGAFDETFFMYGEDVDLSYRIQKAGLKNYYLADTTIIHFKGESTKRGSLNYVRLFYSAMSIFVKKHYGGARGTFFHLAIQAAIWLRALVAAVAKGLKWVGLPVIDAALILASFLFVKAVWETYVRPDVEYPRDLLLIALPVFTVAYLVVAYYAGLYDKEYKQSNLFRSTLIATLFLLAGYALLPEHLRFSRAILLFGALFAFILIYIVRALMVQAGVLNAEVRGNKPYILIAGSPAETNEVKALFEEAGLTEKIIDRVETEKGDSLKVLEEADSMAPVLEAKELVFCIGEASYAQGIQLAQRLKTLRLRFHASGSNSIVGSDSSGTTGDVIGTGTSFNLKTSARRRLKRLIDVVSSFLFIISFPVHLFFVPHPIQFLSNCVQVLVGSKTWIGYSRAAANLPLLRAGIISPSGHSISHQKAMHTTTTEALDYWYARNYEPQKDLIILLKNYRQLGS